VAGHQQDDRRPPGFPELLQQGEAVHLGQDEVGDDDGRVLRLDEVERLLAGRGRLHLVSPLADEPRQALALGGLVVHHEDLAGPHLVSSARHVGDPGSYFCIWRLLTTLFTPVACRASCSALAFCSGEPTVPLR
jgi:hypothetical protein